MRDDGDVALRRVAADGVIRADDAGLSAHHMQRLDEASAVPMGFPHEMVAASRDRLAGGKAQLTDFPAQAVR